MITVVGDALRGNIIDEIKKAKYFTILADEVTDCANLEQLSLVIRFVDEEMLIREEFLDFIAVERITGESLSVAILTWLRSWEIDIANCRGQGYDGASNMASSRVGVQGRISEICPLAFYTHCQAHQLNLCVVKGCSVPQIRNASGAISEIAKFFNYSPKRQHFFEKVIKSSADGVKRAKLKDLCKTRWIERIDSFLAFHDLYPFIIHTMQVISTRSLEHGDWSWDPDTVTKASGFLHHITTFEFLVLFCVAMRLLSSLRGLTIKLQKQSKDILQAYEQVSDVQLELELMAENCEEEFHAWFKEMTEFATLLDVPVTVPRVHARQVHRSNIPADTPEAYYRRNIMIPFLDHILSEMRHRFGEIHRTTIKLLGLIPSIIVDFDAASIDALGELYRADLPSPQLLSTEFRRWKSKFASMTSEKRPCSLQSALQHCDSDASPKIRELLLIACTLPVTVCENERANSQLKRLKTYLRSTMTEQRLLGLAIMQIHRKKIEELDLDTLVTTFANKHPRRILLPCLLSD